MKLDFKVKNKETGKYMSVLEKADDGCSLAWIGIDSTGVYLYERSGYPKDYSVEVTDITEDVEVECEILQLGKDLEKAGSSVKLARQVLYDNLVI